VTAKSKRVLILYVDKDGDITKVTNIPTPIIGRDKNYEAALSFALSSPEDSDLNALFYAIKLYDELNTKKVFDECQIATISGEVEEGIESDIRIREELETVLSKFNADGAIFVSDGGRDELVIPIVSSILPIISIKRVIVGQSEGVEETFVILSRYIRKILNEPYLRRLIVGIPGILFILYAFLSFLNLSQLFSIAIILFLGIIAFVKGFNIDDVVIEAWSKYKLQSTSFVLASILILLALYNGYNVAYEIYISKQNISPLQLIGEFILAPFTPYLNTVLVCAIALIIFLSSRMLEHYLAFKPVRQDFIGIFFVISMGLILTYIGNVLKQPSYDFKIFGINALFLVLLLFLLNLVVIILEKIY
jgi:putative membrane protein